MTIRRWLGLSLLFGLCLATVPACGNTAPVSPTLTPSPTPAPPSPTRAPATPTPQVPTVTLTPAPPTPTPTPAGPGLTQVQFALDVAPDGQLVYPATAFVFGVTRIYVRFAYQGLADVSKVRSVWYLNENPVVSGTLAWDGGDAGDYVMWMEDSNGVQRGQWRWELSAVRRAGGAVDDAPLGGGAFAIGGEPRYVNDAWGLSFDPPLNWAPEPKEGDFVTFVSPDRHGALVLRAVVASGTLTETAAANLALFQAEHPQAEVVATQEVTLGGEAAILQQVRFADEENGEQVLYLASVRRGDAAYGLWMLGAFADDGALRTLFVVTLRSVRFLER